MIHQATKSDPAPSLPPPLLSVVELEEQLLAADPSVVLVPSRILRRVIKKHSDIGGFGLQVPHRKSYVLRRDELLAIAGREELDLANRELPEVVILLPQPAAGKLTSLPREEMLLKYGRLLFHAHVHSALHQRRHDGALNDDAVRERNRCLGFTEFAEAKAVLHQERFLLSPGDDAQVYEELAAVYLELRFFDPEKLPRYFPSLDSAAAERVFTEDVDAEAVYFNLSPHFRGDGDAAALGDDAAETREPSEVAAPAPQASQRQELLAAADRAEKKGNVVRAAFCGTRAGAAGAGERALGMLVERLQKALHFSCEDAAVWRRGLTALLEPASSEMWPVEARLLYDLQKICIDNERATYAADLVEWVVSWGKRPVKRLLPYQGDVQSLKHLRGAIRRLAAARLDEATRHDLVHFLHDALHHAEEELRQRLRPVLVRSLDKADMSPTNAAEKVARDKLVEELLDLIVERGYLNLGDLRDAIARNRLKMPDLAGVNEFIHGDRLIRVNRRFAEALDGIYRRGEIYLRWLQRLNSVAFGTVVGRFLMRFFVLPFGCAFVFLEGVQHLLHEILHWTGVVWVERHTAEDGVTTLERHGPHIHLAQPWVIGVVGVFILGLLHLPLFRRAVLRVLEGMFLTLHFLLIDLPAFIVRLPLVQVVLQSRLYLLFYQFIVKPLAFSALMALPLYFLNAGLPIVLYSGAATFLATTILLNSPLGQLLEETISDRLARGWYLLRDDVLPGLFRWIMFVFRQMVGGVERVIYTVDEWLRFRQGDSPTSFRFKVVLGLVWFWITYIVRFAVNVLIEPQLNPIKHFPVVTVGHKLVLPLALPQGRGQPSTLAVPLISAFNMGIDQANALALSFVWGIPGIFGFLVWELKENWRLYRANQSPVLFANMVGSHGETVLRLLRPGFHSGTLPKLYAKLRRAQGRGLRKQTEALHHVVECVRRFVERTLLATLAGSERWGMASSTRVAAIQCGCNRIRVELGCSPLAGETLLLDLEVHAGRLIAGIARRGWLAALSAEQARVFEAALAGFYKFAGADMVRERVAALLPAEATFAVTEAGIVVQLGDAEASYELGEAETLEPRSLRGAVPAGLPKLARKDVLFSETDLRWSDWCATWQASA